VSLDPSMRASDGDREAVADRLRDAHAEGRLSIEEFQERLDLTLAAKTLGELTAVTRDLPVGTALSAPAGGPATPYREGRPRLRGIWGAWATSVVICVGIWATTSLGSGELGYFWPIWVAGPWGAVLVARTVFGHRHRPPGR
jgi:hypothetical protein